VTARARLAVAIAAAAATMACTRIIHSGGAGGAGGAGGSGPPPPVAHVQMLWTINLPRSAANLSSFYAELHDGFVAALADVGVAVDQDGVAAQYGQPGLVWGESERVHPNRDLASVLRDAAGSGAFEPPSAPVPEQENLAVLGARLPSLTIPPPLTGGDSIPLYGRRDGMVVATVQATRRLCGIGDGACALGGRPPADYFAATAPDGSAAWLAAAGGGAGLPAGRIFFVDFVTSEGESPDAFRARCAAVPGFSRTLLDVMAPSPSIYYYQLVTELGGRGAVAVRVDLCEALGDDAGNLAKNAAHAIAGRFGQK
jgi:hypothetical protein